FLLTCRPAELPIFPLCSAPARPKISVHWRARLLPSRKISAHLEVRPPITKNFRLTRMFALQQGKFFGGSLESEAPTEPKKKFATKATPTAEFVFHANFSQLLKRAAL
ncbi:MAG: hypothetical protein ACK4I8_00410, partial [Armatimonadota bacterium]